MGKFKEAKNQQNLKHKNPKKCKQKNVCNKIEKLWKCIFEKMGKFKEIKNQQNWENKNPKKFKQKKIKEKKNLENTFFLKLL